MSKTQEKRCDTRLGLWQVDPLLEMNWTGVKRSLFLGFSLVFVVTGKPGAGAQIEFNRDIRPILSENCFQCHGPDAKRRKAKLRFDTPESALQERDGRQAIMPGDLAKSELITRVTTVEESERMPPPESGRELSGREIELLRRWIKEGARYQSHWVFLSPSRSTPPEVIDVAWAGNPVDRFILSRLEAEGIIPSSRADKVTLIRRLHFDLTGLPPSSEAAADFVMDDSPDAFRLAVESLLASPRYGERMAVYWFDLVRYANTVGYHGDQDHAIIPYRDYVIQAFNKNMPFDKFTVEQLAGDLLKDPTINQKIASGYNRMLQTSHEGGVQALEYKAKYAADRVRNLSGVWLGATIGCAECHDHKYDPYTQKDFYSLAAFFADVNDDLTFKGSNTLPTRRDPEMIVVSPLAPEDPMEVERKVAHLEKQIQERTRAKGSKPQRAPELASLKAELQKWSRLRQRTMVTGRVKPRVMRVLNRGDWMDDSGDVVKPDVPGCLPPLELKGRVATRLDLARWLTMPGHPQTARVFVNRLWYLFFGEGIASSLDDNGSQGEWPAHPGLLDWLAIEFVQSGWNVKHIVRLIVTSNTYQQSSLGRPDLLKRDSQTRLFARQSRFRLPAEFIRDNALKIGGLMVNHMGLSLSRPYQPVGYYAPLNFPSRTYSSDSNENQYRRGVYMHWQRQFLHPMLRAFDAPTREECTVRRPISNTPLASLTLLNDSTFVEAARAFAVQILQEGGHKNRERVLWAWRKALSRRPTPEETAIMLGLYSENLAVYRKDHDLMQQLLKVGLKKTPAGLPPDQVAAWTAVARAILNLNETITRN